MIGTGVFISALVIFLLAAMFPQITIRIGQWFIDRLLPQRLRQQTSGLTHKFLDGLAALRSPFSILMVFVTSLVIWLLETGKYWLVMQAFHLMSRFLR